MINETREEYVERRRKSRRRARIAHVLGAMLGIVLVAPIFIAIFDRRQPIDFEKGRMHPRVVRPGQVVEVTWWATRHRKCDGEFTRRVIDASGTIHTFVVELDVYPPMGRTDEEPEMFTRAFQLPVGLVPGPAFYTPRGRHYCNVLQKWLWPIEFEAPWVPFTVMPPDPLPSGSESPPERIVPGPGNRPTLQPQPNDGQLHPQKLIRRSLNGL